MKPFVLILLFQPCLAFAGWGFFAHQKINKMAVYALPEQMNSFFLKNIAYLEAEAIKADQRRYTDPKEAPKHYIDIDYYSVDSPFVVVPQRWNDAVAKYSEDTLRAYGILPWHIQSMYYKLVKAMEEGKSKRVLYLAADLGHYIADAHVPLHTTLNHNGQLSQQKGIHAFWESRLPELFADDYHYWVGSASYKPSVLQTAWEVIQNSHAAKDSVLQLEKQLSQSFPSDQQYAYESKGQATAKVYSLEYATAYHQALNGMVERQMQEAIHCLASLWYSAWVDAGQPKMEEW